MTWSGKLRVQDVSDGPAPIDVLAAANVEDGDPITSNTEGAIVGMELKLRLNADTTNIKVGDEIYVSGHFQG